MLRLEVENDDTYNIYQIVQFEGIKSRVIDDLKKTIEMINEIDSALNTEKQAEMLSRILQINIGAMNKMTYLKTNDIRDFFMRDVDGWYESSFEQFIYYNTKD